MSSDRQDYNVTEVLEDGEIATFQLVPDAAGGKLFLWLDPGLDPQAVVTFYRITQEGAEPLESWQNFQDAEAIAPFAGEQRAPLGAVEQLEAGRYSVEARLFTGFDTVSLPAVAIEIAPVREDPGTADARAAFNAAFTVLFRKFFAQQDTARDARAFFDAFDAEQAGFLVDAVVELGAPEDYAEEETTDISGFFDVIDYATALFHAGGATAQACLANQPDSPTNRHYIHRIKQFLAHERLLEDILEKYPYCRGG